MCGRFIQKSERKIITEEFYVQEFLDEVIISYNIAPGQNAGIILNDGETKYAQYKWGLVPSWAKDPSIGNKMINARAETAQEKPSFRQASVITVLVLREASRGLSPSETRRLMEPSFFPVISSTMGGSRRRSVMGTLSG